MTVQPDVAEFVAPSGPAARLAVLLSPAARIEPELIRAMRLAVLPAAGVGTEAELWFSDWVATRSVDAITLHPDLLPDLRQQLGRWIRHTGEDDPVNRVWTVLDQVHAGSPPALRLEEHIARLSVTGEGSIADALATAVQAVVGEGRNGLTQWFAGAWRRLPPEVHATLPAWQLVQIATHHRGLDRHFAGAPVPGELTTRDAAVIAAALGDVEIGVRRQRTTLTFGETGAALRQTIKVPDTRPRLLDVIRTDLDGDGAVRTIAVHEGATVSIEVGLGPLRIRTARGTIYELRPSTAPLGGLLRRGIGWLPLLRRRGPLPEGLRTLLKKHQAAHPGADVELILRAYQAAAKAHEKQYRLSGEPYVAHCLAVAELLADLRMDSTTIAAGLLHGTIEHSTRTLDRLYADFGPALALIVDGVTKLDRMKIGDSARAETIRKLVLAMARDPRVLVVKLADQLENMRTVSMLSPREREYRAGETLDILVPLASRLGMGAIQRELSDLAFRALLPEGFRRAYELSTFTPDAGEVIERLRTGLNDAGLRAEVLAVPPHLYEIYQDLVRSENRTPAGATRVVRVLVDTDADCYLALGVAHELWQPIAGRFRDAIAIPEFRTYRSLHTAVLGPDGGPVELQIRSHAMHRDAEYGVAALWHTGDLPGDQTDRMIWMWQLLDWQRETSDPGDFLDALRFELATPQICVFTTAGDVVALPAGATPVDFAYAVHTEVGHRCVAARVNGGLFPLGNALSNGDVVEIVTSDESGPAEAWLGFVTTPRARTKIQQYYNAEHRETAIEAGKAAIVAAVHQHDLSLQRVLNAEALSTIAQDLGLADVAALYAAVGGGQASARSILRRFLALQGGDMADLAEPPAANLAPPRLDGPGQSVDLQGVDSPWIKLARCCNPLPGDAVFGYFIRSGGVTVHRDDCEDMESQRAEQPDRVLEAAWRTSTTVPTFRVVIQVEAFAGHEVLADVTRVLSDEGAAIVSATITTTWPQVMISRIGFELADPQYLDHLIAAVRRIDGVFDVYRVTSAST